MELITDKLAYQHLISSVAINPYSILVIQRNLVIIFVAHSREGGVGTRIRQCYGFIAEKWESDWIEIYYFRIKLLIGDISET